MLSFCLHTNNCVYVCVLTQQAYCYIPQCLSKCLFTPHTPKTSCSSVFINLFRVCPKREGYVDDSQQLFSASAPPASLSLLGNFEVYHTNTLKVTTALYGASLLGVNLHS